MDGIALRDRNQIIWLFFGFSGRISRAAFFLGGLLLAVVQAFFLYRFAMVPEDSPEGRLWATAFMLIVIVSMWSSVALGAKRLHDMGRPGVLAVSLIIPVVSIIAFIALCAFPGTPGANQYGPRTNSPAEKS